MLAVRLVMKVEVHTVGTVDLQTRFKAQIVHEMQGFGPRGQTKNKVEEIWDPGRHSSLPHAACGGRRPTFLLIFMSGLKEPNYLAFGDSDIAFGHPKDNKFLNRTFGADRIRVHDPWSSRSCSARRSAGCP